MTYSLNTCGNDMLRPFLNDFFGVSDNLTSENYGRLAMKTDIRETKEAFAMDVELPGFKKEDIQLSFEDGYLTVTATAKTIEKKENGEKDGFVYRERFSGTASRSFYLGDVEENEIKASFENGILKVVLPKKVEKEPENKTIVID